MFRPFVIDRNVFPLQKMEHDIGHLQDDHFAPFFEPLDQPQGIKMQDELADRFIFEQKTVFLSGPGIGKPNTRETVRNTAAALIRQKKDKFASDMQFRQGACERQPSVGRCRVGTESSSYENEIRHHYIRF